MKKLTSNIKPFGRIVVVTENVNTRGGKPIDEECAAGEDQGFVFFQLSEASKVEILIGVVQVCQVVDRVVVIFNPENQ